MIKAGSIKGAIFDVDGVLLDSMGIWWDLGARYLTRLGMSPEKNLGETLFPMSMEQGAAYLRWRYLPGKTVGKITDDLREMLREYYFFEVPAKPGAAQLLGLLASSGVRMAAATSSPKEHVEKALARNGILGYMSGIFTVSELGISKHSPEIFHLAAKHIGTSPDETYVFEDSLYALRTAAAAGYRTAGVFDALGERDQKGLYEAADVYIRSLAEFTDRISKA